MDVFKMLYQSFGSVGAYRRAVFGWRWKTLAYFVLLTLLSGASAVLATHSTIENFYDQSITPALAELSSVKVSDGKVKTPNGADVELKDRNGRVFAIASEKLLDASRTKGLMFAFERDRVSFYLPDGGENSMSLKDYDKLLGDRGVDAIFPSRNVLLYAITPLACLFFFVLPMNLIFWGLMTVAVYILSRTLYAELSLGGGARLALCALTPSIVVDIVSMSAFGYPMQGFAYALISGGMAYYVLRNFRTAVGE